MPSHLGQNGQLRNGKSFLNQENAISIMEAQLKAIVENIRDKKSLGWTLSKLQDIEKQMKK
jgi:hypothetical protein